MFEKFIEKTFIINLQESIYRYNSSLFELSKYNITNFEFIKAFDPKSKKLKELYKNKRVMGFPPCFRCKKEKCNHENNILIPRQIANFLSFKLVMEKISSTYSNGLFLILEDDFYFKNFSKHGLNTLAKFSVKNNLGNINRPVLLRIGSHTLSRRTINWKMKYLHKTTVTKNNFNMANPGFIVNNAFAKLFLDNFNKIETTSDDFIHKQLCKEYDVLNFSFEPFIIGQYSYGSENNYFISDIGYTKKDKNNKQRVSSETEYKQLLNLWIN